MKNYEKNFDGTRAEEPISVNVMTGDGDNWRTVPENTLTRAQLADVVFTYGEPWVADRAFCKAFYETLCLWFNGSETKTCQCVASAGMVADHMEMTPEDAEKAMRLLCHYGITERQGGAYVI